MFAGAGSSIGGDADEAGPITGRSLENEKNVAGGDNPIKRKFAQLN
jgi:hypothetical protein